MSLLLSLTLLKQQSLSLSRSLPSCLHRRADTAGHEEPARIRAFRAASSGSTTAEQATAALKSFRATGLHGCATIVHSAEIPAAGFRHLQAGLTPIPIK